MPLRKAHILIAAIAALLMVTACDKAPRGIIGESKMERLITDLNKAQAYTEMFPDQFPNDSAKQALRQSIFAKYDVTQEDYDKSLNWYAHNIEIYTKVYDRADKRLQKDLAKLEKEREAGAGAGFATQVPQAQQHQGRTYEAHGDTADVWMGRKTYVFGPANKDGFVKFEYAPDKEFKRGDRLKLDLKMITGTNRFTLLIAADYADGGTTFMSTNTVFNGWTSIELQTDSTRTVRRIYGYIAYRISDNALTMLDSIALIRTHLDPQRYGSLRVQRTIERNPERRRISTATQQSAINAAPAKPKEPSKEPESKIFYSPNGTAQGANGHFTPKPGVNKSGTKRRIPNRTINP